MTIITLVGDDFVGLGNTLLSRLKQLRELWRITRLSGSQLHRDGGVFIGAGQMNLGRVAAAGSSQGLYSFAALFLTPAA